jgi:hypothetical protein
MRSRDSSVGITTKCGLNGWGSIPVGGKRFFFSQHRPDRLWGSSGILSNGSPGINLPGRETDHSPPSSVEVKNGVAVPPLPHTCSWSCAYLIKHIDSFTSLSFCSYYGHYDYTVMYGGYCFSEVT